MTAGRKWESNSANLPNNISQAEAAEMFNVSELLDIEARIGELLPSPEEAQKLSQKIPKRGLPRSGPHQKVLPAGITQRKAHQARTIKAHPDIVAKMLGVSKSTVVNDLSDGQKRPKSKIPNEELQAVSETDGQKRPKHSPLLAAIEKTASVDKRGHSKKGLPFGKPRNWWAV